MTLGMRPALRKLAGDGGTPRCYGDPMTDLPDWMRPPRPEGWFAEDLDDLPDAPRHTELIDGALVFMMSPQRRWHSQVTTNLTIALAAQAPDGLAVEREMTVRLDDRNRPDPDVVVTRSAGPASTTWYDAADVVLVIEVVSPESAHRDRTVKLRKYAEAGIPHYWRVEDEDGEGATAVHVYELDAATRAYAPAGIVRDELSVGKPFPITLDVRSLYS